MPIAHANGIAIHYELTGSGEPIVWVGGTGVGCGIWKPHQVPHFSRNYRCVIFDLRGTGESSAPEEPYSVATFAEDTAALCDRLEIAHAHFVGISLGSAIIQELALMRPDLVVSAVLISTWSSTRREHHVRRWFEARLLALAEAPIEVFRAFAFWMWAPSVIDEEPELAAEVQGIFAQSSAQQPLHAYVNHFRADLAHETRDRLHMISCPTLVLYGEEDLITLPRYNRTVADLIPSARIRAIPRAGHVAWLERGAEVNLAIEEFLRSLAGGDTAGSASASAT